MRPPLSALRRRLGRARGRGERGVAAVLVAIVVAGTAIPLAAISVDVSRWYVEVSRVQDAADAASLAGVTYLPDNLEKATATATAVAARNGYPVSGDVTVSVTVGDKPTQLSVTVASRVSNAFGASFGQGTTWISRTAVADYNGPAPMGSPCNTFGNEPAGTVAAPEIASQLRLPPGASCSSTPQFWASTHGPEVYKVQGDEFASRWCQGNEDGCSTAGSPKTNTEFDPLGAFYIVRVGEQAVNQTVRLQLYDPEYAATGSTCASGPSGSILTDTWNPFLTDALTRYAKSANAFCAGDEANGATTRHGSAEVPTVTSFGLRMPIDTQRPQDADPITTCARQYPGYGTSSVTTGALSGYKTAGWPLGGLLTGSTYNRALARTFHQWVDLCTFTPTKAGDYYLQVRTDVALDSARLETANGGAWTEGNQKVFSQTGDDTSVQGNGSNRFAIRAIASNAASISVSGWSHMSIFANADAATQVFNLVRVVPAAATKTLDFGFFDVGDAAASGTIRVLPPTESTVQLTQCTGVGKVNGPLTNCSISGINSASGWDGKSQHIRVQIPAAYTCTVSSPGGCWFRVQVGFGTGSVTDATTWSAVVAGDPVRLIQ